MDISTRQLHAFIAVAEELHFTRAANRLNISQPALSAKIQLLEKNLGAKLFDRDGHSIRLTDLGSLFLSSATQLVGQIEDSIKSLSDVVEKQTGHLKVAALPSATFGILVPALGRFHERFPNVKLTMRDALNDHVLEAVARGDVDFGVGVLESDKTEFEELPILEDQFVAVVPANHRLARRTAVKWSDLSQEDIVHVAKGSSVRRMVETELSAKGAMRHVNLQVQFVSGAIQMVRQKLGVSILSDLSCAPYKGYQDIRFLPMKAPPLLRRISVIYRKGRSFSPAAQALLDEMSTLNTI